MGIMENGRLYKVRGRSDDLHEERAVIGVLSKEEIDRIADEILAGLKEGKEEKKPANKPVKEIPGLSVVADVKAEASVRENRKKQEQEILEAAAEALPKSEGNKRSGEKMKLERMN